MSDPKQLRFQFVVDEASIQKVRQLVRDLTSDFQKLAQVMGGAQGGGGGGIFGGMNIHTKGATTGSPEQSQVLAKTAPVGRQLVQNFLDQKDIFKGIADGSKESLRMMSDSLRQAIDVQKREIKDLDNAAAHLAETYRNMGKEIQDLKSATGGRFNPVVQDLENQQRGVGLEHAKTMSERAREQGRLGDLQSMGITTGDWQGPIQKKGFFDKIGDRYTGIAGEGGEGGLNMKKLIGQAVAAAAVVGFGINESKAGYQGMAGLATERQNAISPMFQRVMGGDMLPIMALARMTSGDRKDLSDEALSTTATLDRGVDEARGSLGSIPLVGKYLGGGSAGPGGVAGNLSDAHANTLKAQAFMRHMDQNVQLQFSPMEIMAYQQFQGDLSSRVASNRILGGGLSQLHGDTAGMQDARLQAMGYNRAQYAGSFASMRNAAGGEFARRMAFSNMAAGAAGYGGFGEMSAAGARAGGVNSAFGYGAIGGGIDKQAGINLGSAIIGNGFDPMGTTSGLGVLSAVQHSGMISGGVNDFNMVNRVGAGMGLLNSVTSGGMDPYQQGRNLVGAIGRLGPGASTYAQDYLGNGMNFRQMMDVAGGGKMTATGRALGLTQGDVKAQLGDSVSSVFDRFVDTGAGDPMSKAIRAFRSSGQGLGDYLGGLKGKSKKQAVENLGAYFGMQSGQGEEAGLGAMGILSGMSQADVNKISKGKIGGGVGEGEKTALEGLAKQREELAKTLGGMVGEIEAAFGKAGSFARGISGMGDLSKNLDGLLDAVSRTTASFNALDAYLKGKLPVDLQAPAKAAAPNFTQDKGTQDFLSGKRPAGGRGGY